MVVAQLDHPYICKIYEILEQGNQLFIVLEFVRGRPLSELIGDASKPLPLEKALDLGREIAEALEEAHKSGVVHRDIKPKNIMLIESGHIKVLDFGLAKALQPSADLTGAEPTTLTEPGQIMGTPFYMSPEQITGQTADPRSDIFSFGVVMFEMIAGVRPFSGATAAQVIGSIMTGESEPLHRYRKGVPDALDRVIQRMLAKDPSERYQSVHEVWVELRHIREELVARSSRAARAISQEQAIGGAETVVRPLPGDVTLPPTTTPARRRARTGCAPAVAREARSMGAGTGIGRRRRRRGRVRGLVSEQPARAVVHGP